MKKKKPNAHPKSLIDETIKTEVIILDQLELVLKAKRGDSAAFYSLLIEHKAQMYKIAYSYLHNEQDALEAIQETTYRAFNNIYKLKRPEYFKTWLFRILMNYCIDENKRKKKYANLPDIETIGEYEDIERKLTVDHAISKLNEKYQSVILLKYFEDLTINDIALIMRKPVGTIKTWLNKALKELRPILGEEEMADAARRKNTVGVENSI